MIAIRSGMRALQFFFSLSVIHFLLTELDVQGTVTLSDGVLSITEELQIHSQSLNTERCYYHLETSLKIRQSLKVVDCFLTALTF